MRFTGVDLHDNPMASFGKVQAEVHNPWLFAFYVVGLVAASWHFAYGIWLFCREVGHRFRRQGAAAAVCGSALAFFMVLSVVGFASLYTFRARFQADYGRTVRCSHRRPLKHREQRQVRKAGAIRWQLPKLLW